MDPALLSPAEAVFTGDEAAALLKVSTSTVAAMTRDGRLPRVPGLRRLRIPRWAVLALLQGDYDARRGEPDGQAPGQAPAPRRGHGAQADGPLAGEAVGGGDPLHRPIGQTPGDLKWHGLRASTITILLAEGVPEITVAAIMGHRSLEMTNRYTKLLPRVSRDAAERMGRAIG